MAQENTNYVSVDAYLNKSSALPLDAKVRNRPDYLKQNDNLNVSTQISYAIAIEKHYFLIGLGYENRFSYTDKIIYTGYCGVQTIEYSKVYVRNINSFALSLGFVYCPLKNNYLKIGTYINLGVTGMSWYKEVVQGTCLQNNNYYEESNGNSFYSSNLFFQYDFLRCKALVFGIECKISHRSYRFFFSDLNYGAGLNLKVLLN